jgi:hypothetical protein
MDGETTTERVLRFRVQVEWEKAMDVFFERLDKLSRSSEITDSDVIKAVRRQIDEDTADAYEDWIGDE